MTIRLPRYSPGDVIEFDGTPGERAANILSHAWAQEANPMDENCWRRGHNTPRPETLSRCSQCNAVKELTHSAEWPCGQPRLAVTHIW